MLLKVVPLSAFCVVYLLTIIGCGSVQPEKKALVSAGFVIAEQDLDFGERFEQSTFKWPVTIRNPTSNDVRVLECYTSCSCVGVEPESFVVRSGGTVEIELTLDLRSGDGSDISTAKQQRETFEFEAQIIPRFHGENGRHSEAWTLHGSVR